MKLLRRHFEIIQEQAFREQPYECCGLLAGVSHVDHRGNIENVVYEIAPCHIACIMERNTVLKSDVVSFTILSRRPVHSVMRLLVPIIRISIHRRFLHAMISIFPVRVIPC